MCKNVLWFGTSNYNNNKNNGKNTKKQLSFHAKSTIVRNGDCK